MIIFIRSCFKAKICKVRVSAVEPLIENQTFKTSTALSLTFEKRFKTASGYNFLIIVPFDLSGYEHDPGQNKE